MGSFSPISSCLKLAGVLLGFSRVLIFSAQPHISTGGYHTTCPLTPDPAGSDSSCRNFGSWLSCSYCLRQNLASLPTIPYLLPLSPPVLQQQKGIQLPVPLGYCIFSPLTISCLNFCFWGHFSPWSHITEAAVPLWSSPLSMYLLKQCLLSALPLLPHPCPHADSSLSYFSSSSNNEPSYFFFLVKMFQPSFYSITPNVVFCM